MQEESLAQTQANPVPVDNSVTNPVMVTTDPAQQAPVVPSVEAAPEEPVDLVLGEVVAPTPETMQTAPEVATAPTEEPAVAVQTTPPAETAPTEPTPANETQTAVTPEAPSEPIAPQEAPVDPTLSDQTVPSEQVPQPSDEPTRTTDIAVKPPHAPIVVIVAAVIIFVGLSAAALYLYFKK